MKKIISYIRTHTFSKIILTFISILTVSMTALGMFSYYAYRSSLLKNAVESGHTEMNHIMGQIEHEIEGLQYAIFGILTNTALVNFESYRFSSLPDDQFRLKKMMREIQYLESSYPVLDSIWLYSNRSDSFVTRSGNSSREEFFEKRFVLRPVAGRTPRQALNEYRTLSYLGTAGTLNPTDETSYFSFVRSINEYSSKPDGQIILNIESRVFTDILDQAASRDDLTILLLDRNGIPIVSSRNTRELDPHIPEILERLQHRDAPQQIEFQGVKYTGWAVKSSKAGIQYLALINNRVLLQKVNYIRLLTFGLVLICLFLSAVLAFSLTNRLFDPIRKIVSCIEIEQGGLIADGCHDALLIEKFIEYMKSQNLRLHENIDQYTSLMWDALLVERIYSREQQTVMELYQKADVTLSFPYHYFTVAVIPLQVPDQIRSLSGEKLAEQIRALQKEPPFACEMSVRLLPQKERLVVIFNTKESAPMEIHRFLNAIKKFYSDAEKKLLYAYGKTYSSIAGLYDSFHQAMNILVIKPDSALPPRRSTGGDSARGTMAGGNPYEEAINSKYITSSYTQDVELKLMKLVKSRGSGDLPAQFLREIIQENKESGTSSLRMESLFVQLIMTIHRILEEMRLDGSVIFGKDVNHYRALDSFSSEEEKERYILETFERLTAYVRSIKSSKTLEIYQSMLSYITERYHEDLSLNDISYQMGLSPSYLSSVFKEYQHSTFLDYLNRYRIAKAKPLLLNSHDSVASIAQMVGYTNVNTFIRIFKKEEGVTPGQFRLNTWFRA